MGSRKVRTLSDEWILKALNTKFDFPEMTAKKYCDISGIPVGHGTVKEIWRSGSVDAYHHMRASRNEKYRMEKQKNTDNSSLTIPTEKVCIQERTDNQPDIMDVLQKLTSAVESMAIIQAKILEEIRMPNAAKSNYARTIGEQFVNIGANTGAMKKKFMDMAPKVEQHMNALNVWMDEFANRQAQSCELLEKLYDLWAVPEHATL